MNWYPPWLRWMVAAYITWTWIIWIWCSNHQLYNNYITQFRPKNGGNLKFTAKSVSKLPKMVVLLLVSAIFWLTCPLWQTGPGIRLRCSILRVACIRQRWGAGGGSVVRAEPPPTEPPSPAPAVFPIEVSTMFREFFTIFGECPMSHLGFGSLLKPNHKLPVNH